MALNQQLTPKLTPPRLSGVLATLETRHRQAIDGQWADVEFLERWLEDEIERRAYTPLARRVRRAALKTIKTLDGFDWRVNLPINQPQVRPRASCEDLRQKRHMWICGPHRRGQTPSRTSPHP